MVFSIEHPKIPGVEWVLRNWLLLLSTIMYFFNLEFNSGFKGRNRIFFCFVFLKYIRFQGIFPDLEEPDWGHFLDSQCLPMVMSIILASLPLVPTLGNLRLPPSTLVSLVGLPRILLFHPCQALQSHLLDHVFQIWL